MPEIQDIVFTETALAQIRANWDHQRADFDVIIRKALVLMSARARQHPEWRWYHVVQFLLQYELFDRECEHVKQLLYTTPDMDISKPVAVVRQKRWTKRTFLGEAYRTANVGLLEVCMMNSRHVITALHTPIRLAVDGHPRAWVRLVDQFQAGGDLDMMQPDARGADWNNFLVTGWRLTEAAIQRNCPTATAEGYEEAWNAYADYSQQTWDQRQEMNQCDARTEFDDPIDDRYADFDDVDQMILLDDD